MTSHDDLIDALLEARDLHKKMKAATTDQGKRVAELERKLVDSMMSAGDQSVKKDDGLTVYVRRNKSFRCSESNYEALKQWIQEETGDAADFTMEAVSRSALSAFIDDKLEEGYADEDFPSFLGLSTYPGIGIRGAGSRSGSE
jgi:hypothetical protein